MKRLLLVGLAAVATLAMSAGAITPQSPVTCADQCEIPSHSLYYLPPLLVVQDGTTVTWTSIDTVHVHVETPIQGSAQDGCFLDTSNTDGEAAAVRFDIEDGALLATTDPGTAQAETHVCQNAVGLAQGGFALAYHCVLHNEMRGELVVMPGAL